jgi:hypothetical protein
MAKELVEYEVTQTRFIGGQHRVAGEVVQMTQAQAKYYLAPNGEGLAVKEPEVKAVVKKVSAKPIKADQD